MEELDNSFRSRLSAGVVIYHEELLWSILLFVANLIQISEIVFAWINIFLNSNWVKVIINHSSYYIQA